MEEKWKLGVVLTAIVLTLSAWSVYAIHFLTQLDDEYLYHRSEATRIFIDGNEGFTSANGVVSGTGSVSDPYIISFPEADYYSPTTIEISNTTLSFVLRNSTFDYYYTSGCLVVTEVGIRILNATNFSVEGSSAYGGCIVDGCHELTLSGNSMSTTFVNCSRCTMNHNVGSKVTMVSCTDLSIRENVNLTLTLDACRNSVIANNRFERGIITVGNSLNCLIDSNVCQSITVNAGSADCMVVGNSVKHYSVAGGRGVFLDSVSNVTVDKNTIDNCSYNAIELGDFVTDCAITRNNISNCYGGIVLRGAEACQVYHNNIFSSFWSGGHMLSDPLDSQYHAGGVLDEQGWLNSWDNGYPDGGNYYFDYDGLDLYSGQLQDTLGGDGIGDTPLVIYTYLSGTPAEDHYPLMTPYCG